MVSILNKSLATALLCGAIGLAGTALAQTGAAGSADKDLPAATHTGPGQIDSSADAGNKAKATEAAKPKAKASAKAKVKTSANAKAKSSLNGASNSETASLGASSSEEKPAFLASVQDDKSTPARGLKGAAMKRVDQNERRITAELNRASAASTGNANASNQASINTGSDQNIQ